jgi:DNA helicase-2/ATP-dependent DNA helicase PcrA
MQISHSRFGMGVIVTIDTDSTDARITVDFDNVGIKTLLLKFAKFNIIGK